MNFITQLSGWADGTQNASPAASHGRSVPFDKSYMKRISLLLLAFNLGHTITYSQTVLPDSILAKTVNEQGREMCRLMLLKDYKAYIKYINKATIDIAGSEEKAIELLKNGMTRFESQGYVIINFSIQTPEKFIRVNNEIQCTLVEDVELKMPKGKMIAHSPLIGISINDGNNWTFFATSGKDLKTLQKTIPTLSDKLIIPETQPFTIVQD